MIDGKFLLLFAFCGFLSCQRVERTRQSTEEASAKIDLPEPQRLPQDLKVLTINESFEQERPFLDDYLFGKFFQDRAEFFVIQHSNSTIFGIPVSTVVLYYLDGEHCKTKFVMTEDIGGRLIAEYGNFKIVPLDEPTKELLSKEEIVVTVKENKIINKAFRKYELLWKLNSKIVRYKVDLDNPTEPFVYTEHVPHYDNLYRNLESAS